MGRFIRDTLPCCFLVPRMTDRPVLVSACLLGRTCRYDGSHNRDEVLERELERRGELAIGFCPEEEGGLGTPRPPAWIEGSGASVLAGEGRVVTDAGVDATDAFMRGAELALARCRELGIRKAYLKERSPSCGVCRTHANGTLVSGPGVTAERLARAGIETIGVEGRRSPPAPQGNLT